ncbi:chemotaxis protein CheA [Nitrospira lenta]|uniref:Chemotaxis protein CheA n=1 Tax=Nitrospira lenta TaxID=1436998 RepID=A0A330L5A5_9BACT|nr:chemotaxis protein CheA [Nitrospira lenta]SPP65001.1 CheA signal transduction histidine kinase [Nitrospira lenta]
MNLDSAAQTFLAESRELLDVMEEQLLQLEANPDGGADIDAIFRAAHTIKGSAGLFGFDDVVRFTHRVENLLDRIRGKQLSLDADCVALLLTCCDFIRALIEAISTGEPLTPDAKQTGDGLVSRLDIQLGVTPAAALAPVHTAPAAPAPATSVGDRSEQNPADSAWHISLRFGSEVLRNGMDPLSFLRFLGTLGDVLHLTVITDALPSVDKMDPESCYLGFEIRLRSQADKAQIENVFEFVRDDCQIRILSPRSKHAEYVQLIQALPEDSMRLGEILIKSGALTKAELEQALAQQSVGGPSQTTEAAPPPGNPQLGDLLIQQGVVAPGLVHAALEKQQQVKEHKSQETRFIRVEADKLDQLINLVGELVIAGAGTQLLAKRAGLGDVLESTSTVCRLLEEVRNNALGLRMVQIGATFQRFQRVVRDVSLELGKDIELTITGGETELDKSVVERIGDPLMHLVRNSMDHGIEPRELRLERGKPAKAHITLNAYHDSGSVVIEVTDDGGGLNRERILKKARERGLIGETQVPTEAEIYNLIFAAGFSTAQQISNLSGRGVGMDVVKRNIEALRGTVELLSKETVGTTVQIRLPLTLAIIDGFLVGVGQSRYVIPLDMVLECVEMPEAEKQLAGREGHISLRGQVLPFIRLRSLFVLGGEAGLRENIVVVQYGGQKIGLVVDSLQGEFQTVIKPLGQLFAQLKGFGGFTILGSGDVALILDVPALIYAVTHSGYSPGGAGVSEAARQEMYEQAA